MKRGYSTFQVPPWDETAVPDLETAESTRAIVFGPFRLLLAQRLLLEGEKPVRLGGRAMDILIALVERVGELGRQDRARDKGLAGQVCRRRQSQGQCRRLAPCSGGRSRPPALHRDDDWTGLPLRRADHGFRRDQRRQVRPSSKRVGAEGIAGRWHDECERRVGLRAGGDATAAPTTDAPRLAWSPPARCGNLTSLHSWALRLLREAPSRCMSRVVPDLRVDHET